MTTPKKTLDDLRANPDNPRHITPAKMAQLKKTMAAYGDLSGIVLNRVHPGDPGVLLGGHQRVEAYRQAKDVEVTIAQTYDTPTKAGTTAQGYVRINGEQFAYRETAWDAKKAKAAMLAANKQAGGWDLTGLTAAVNELSQVGFDMDLTGFSELELAPYFADENDLAAEVDAPAPTYPDAYAEQPAPQETGGSKSGLPPGEPTAHIKMVQLFYREADHAQFLQLTDALAEIYRRGNLSDTILEALKRASIKAAIG